VKTPKDNAEIERFNETLKYEWLYDSNLSLDPEELKVDKSKTKGFKGAMATFDATRPIVAAMAIGVGRAALDFVKETLEKEGITMRYSVPRHKLTALEQDVIEMEANHKAARLLTLRSPWMMSQLQPNNLEASMAKAKAGLPLLKSLSEQSRSWDRWAILESIYWRSGCATPK
jgi:transposase InsO family protein